MLTFYNSPGRLTEDGRLTEKGRTDLRSERKESGRSSDKLISFSTGRGSSKFGIGYPSASEQMVVQWMSWWLRRRLDLGFKGLSDEGPARPSRTHYWCKVSTACWPDMDSAQRETGVVSHQAALFSKCRRNSRRMSHGHGRQSSETLLNG